MKTVQETTESYLDELLKEKAVNEKAMWELCEAILEDPALNSGNISIIKGLFLGLNPRDISGCFKPIEIFIKELFHCIEATEKEREVLRKILKEQFLSRPAKSIRDNEVLRRENEWLKKQKDQLIDEIETLKKLRSSYKKK